MRIILTLLVFCLCLPAHAETSQLYIMLDVDHTVADRIDPQDNAYAEELRESGYYVLTNEFVVEKAKNPKIFSAIARRQFKNSFMAKVEITEENDARIKLKEVVAIRPGMKAMLEKFSDIGAYVLICSRNFDERSQALVNSLNLDIQGVRFNELVDFVSREDFRVEVQTSDKSIRPGKSATKLRKKYMGRFGRIKSKDFVMLIDQLEDDWFIGGKRDINIFLEPFKVGNKQNFDRNADQERLDKIIEGIMALR